MSITTYSQLASAEQSLKRYLLDFDIAEVADMSNVETVYATNIPISTLDYNYATKLSSVPSISKNCQGLESKAMPSWGDVTIERNTEIPLVNRTGVIITADDLISGKWTVSGQHIRIRYGGENLPESEYQTIYEGKIKGIKKYDRSKITFDSIDNQSVLQTIYINPNTIAAGSGVPDSSVGKIKPVCVGNCQNISPLLIYAGATYIYLFHDTATVGYDALVSVYDDGAVISFTHNSDGTFTLSARPVGTVTCFVRGAKFGSPAAYKNKIGDISVGLLKSFAGYADGQINTTDITQFNSDIPYEVGWCFTEKTSVVDAINKLFSGIPAVFGMSRNSVFSAREFKKPVGSSAIKIDNPTNVSGKYETDIIYKKRIKYNRNATPIPEKQVGGTDMAWRAWMAQEWRESIHENSSIKTDFSLAIEDKDVSETCLINRADALAIAEKWVLLKGSLRRTFDFETKPLKLNYDVAIEIQILYSQFDMTAGQYAIIMSINEDYSGNKAVMGVMIWL